MNRVYYKIRQTTSVMVFLFVFLLPLQAAVPYPGALPWQAYPYSGYYGAPYSGMYLQPGAWPGYRQGYGGYTRPRWHVRGHIDRDGHYRLDIKLRNISQYDMYQAWLLYQQFGYR